MTIRSNDSCALCVRIILRRQHRSFVAAESITKSFPSKVAAIRGPIQCRRCSGCVRIFEIYFVHNLSSAANCNRISATRLLFSGPSF